MLFLKHVKTSKILQSIGYILKVFIEVLKFEQLGNLVVECIVLSFISANIYMGIQQRIILMDNNLTAIYHVS